MSKRTMPWRTLTAVSLTLGVAALLPARARLVGPEALEGLHRDCSADPTCSAGQICMGAHGFSGPTFTCEVPCNAQNPDADLDCPTPLRCVFGGDAPPMFCAVVSQYQRPPEWRW